MGTRSEARQAILQSAISSRARLILLATLLAVPFMFYLPLWTMSFQSNQYPDPLRLEIYIDHLEGQKTPRRDDLREINSLNHYIGMRPLLESDFSEFLWMPFVVGFLVLIVLRCLVFGSIKDLVDIVVLYLYFGGFAAWTFYSRLYEYGHNLDPSAAVTVEPFTPPFFGRVRVANFWIESYPGGGSYAMIVFGVLLAAALFVAYRGARKR
ncbi:MAG TPA: hypothetical protein VLV83_02640 [Acidobacteriota bacterium]|nr:hypothetical protein [Acidobacteriota bacterium]